MQAVTLCKNPGCLKVLPREEGATRGHRKREYCNDACKQAHYRTLQQHKRSDGERAHDRALEEARARIAELEQRVSHLEYQLNLEQRFYQDTQARAFPSWLRKQAPSPFISKLLSEQL